MDDSLCYEKFKEAEKNASGYSYWKHWVERQLRDCKKDEILDLFKYYQIKMEIVERVKNPDSMSVFLPISTLCITFLTIASNTLLTIATSLLDASSEYNEQITIEQYMELVASTLNNSIDAMAQAGRWMGILVAIIIILSYILETLFQRQEAKKYSYYKQLIEILQEIYDSRLALENKYYKSI